MSALRHRRLALVAVVAVLLALAGFGLPATAGARTAATASTSTVYPANAAATNLAKESSWPGAQDYPYLCCWISQGQYATFTFTSVAGSASLGLNYSAGSGAAAREIDVDGVAVATDETFPATANWSTWSTVTVTQTLTAGTHTLKVWFNAAGGSKQYINLDNLTVNQGTPPVTVSVGYADSTAGITPWSGSPNTLFIGEPAQCCSTHGSNIGEPTYDGGAIEVANTSASPVTLNAVTVDFGGGSSPSHFDLWGGGGTGKLPQVLAPGEQVVMTMDSGFNFDTSDLFGEACHPNTGVVPDVHITVNGVETDYLDDHQVLTSEGTDLASCLNAPSEQHPFAVIMPGAQPAAGPAEFLPPTLTGPAVEGRVMSGFAAAWDASPPPTLSWQWLRCAAAGGSCAPISGATSANYIPGAADVGSTLEIESIAANASGTASAESAPSGVIVAGPAVAQLGDTSTGFTSSFVTWATELASPVTATQSGTTTDFEFFARGAGNTQQFTPKIYASSNGAKGALLATGSPVTVAQGANGQWYTSALSGFALTAGRQYFLALDNNGAYDGSYVGGESGGPNSFFVDYVPSAATTGTRYPANAAATNLPTESSWPGAQSYPYLCCWIKTGQYATFTFTVAAGTPSLAIRYSAGSGPASREIELDGVPVAANETFPSTGNWSTWSTVTLTPTLTAGSHTLEILFNSADGSAQYINLDNLTVTQAAGP